MPRSRSGQPIAFCTPHSYKDSGRWLPRSFRVRSLLIDSSHKWWFIVFAVGAVGAPVLYEVLGRHEPNGLTGGSTVGLWYGVAGAALMLYAGLLAVVRKLPRKRFPFTRQWWLRGHIWLGLLSVVVIACHSHYRFGGPLEQALWIAFALTIATGVYGLALQGFLPHWMTSRVICEIPYEQIPVVCRIMLEKADALIDTLCGAVNEKSGTADGGSAKLGGSTKARLRAIYESEVRPFLIEPRASSSRLAHSVRAAEVFAEIDSLPGIDAVDEQASELKTFCTERRLLAEQERLYRWLHGWLAVHVPLSVAVLVLGAIHVWTALKY